jgi:hypothetical protein
LPETAGKNEDVDLPITKETRFPSSISIGELLQAGKLIKPKPYILLEIHTSTWKFK